MDAVLSVIALAVLLAGGFGATVLLFGRRARLDILELLSLSIYFGLCSVALSLFVFGYLFRHPFVTAIVTVVQIALLAGGWVAWRRRDSSVLRWGIVETTLILGLVFAQTAFFVWTTLHSSLGWDGMVIWEFKAHLIAFHHGHLPFSHISDLRLRWTHNSYPLLFPLSKAWLYLWIGKSHQQLGKLIEVLLYLAAAAQIYSGVRRLAGSVAGGFAGVFILFVVPFIHIGDGSIGSGLVDFALAAFYLAAVRYVTAYAASGSRHDLMLAGALAGAGCWVKQEGVVLWLVAVVLIVVLTAEWRERWSWVAGAILPGAAVVVGWKLFRLALKVGPEGVYMPATIANFLEHVGRLPLAVGQLLKQLAHYPTWSVVWYAVPAAALVVLVRSARRRALVLLAAIVVPMAIYCSVYIFTNWDPLLHIQNSLARLLLAPLLVAILLIGFAVGEAVNLIRNPFATFSPRIALLTDFGTSDPYVGSMKGVIAARTAAPVFDLAHDVAPQDIFGAAWFLRTAERWWPAGTIFVGVVDPGVGTSRRILVLTRGEKVFLAPDNGLLTFVADGAVVRSVEDESSFLPDGSSTFHGRDRFAPLAAAIANGMPVEKLGPRMNDMVRLLYERGMIVAIDRFGNAITDLEPSSDGFVLKTGGHTLDRVCRTYADGGDGPFLIVGSSGFLEIAIRNGSAASMLGLQRGDRVELRKL